MLSKVGKSFGPFDKFKLSEVCAFILKNEKSSKNSNGSPKKIPPIFALLFSHLGVNHQKRQTMIFFWEHGVVSVVQRRMSDLARKTYVICSCFLRYSKSFSSNMTKRFSSIKTTITIFPLEEKFYCYRSASVQLPGISDKDNFCWKIKTRQLSESKIKPKFFSEPGDYPPILSSCEISSVKGFFWSELFKRNPFGRSQREFFKCNQPR